MGRTTPTSTGCARPTGACIWLRVNASVVLDDADEPAFIRTVSLDITALKQAEAEREHSHSLLQATLDATADAIFVADLEGHVTASNRAFAELWQIPQQLLDTVDRKLSSTTSSTAWPTRMSSSAA